MAWILSFRIDLIACTATLDITDDPDIGSIDRTLVFTGVGDVQLTRYHGFDEDDRSLGDFLWPIHEEPVGANRRRLQLDTGDAVVRFEACVGG